jgi:pentatricopeptide repeat protein
VSYVWAMQACNKANKWQKAMSIWHDLLDRHNVELTEPACAAAIEVSTAVW